MTEGQAGVEEHAQAGRGAVQEELGGAGVGESALKRLLGPQIGAQRIYGASAPGGNWFKQAHREAQEGAERLNAAGGLPEGGIGVVPLSPIPSSVAPKSTNRHADEPYVDGEAWEKAINQAGDPNHVIEGEIDGHEALNIEVYRLQCSCGVKIEGYGRKGAGQDAATQHHREAPWSE